MVCRSDAKSPKKRSLKGKGVKTPPEVQAQIIAALLFGQFNTDEQVAEATGVSKHTVGRIRKRIPSEYLIQVETLKKDRIGDLVVEYLEKALESQIRIDEVTLNEEWLFQQDAASLATFYGVKADKVYRLLEAIERANHPNQEEVGVVDLC
jgi:DNA-binding transcriptional regulator LsrR (DeoR family)